MGRHTLDELVDWFSEVDNFVDMFLACKHEIECVLAPCEVYIKTQRRRLTNLR